MTVKTLQTFRRSSQPGGLDVAYGQTGVDQQQSAFADWSNLMAQLGSATVAPDAQSAGGSQLGLTPASPNAGLGLARDPNHGGDIAGQGTPGGGGNILSRTMGGTLLDSRLGELAALAAGMAVPGANMAARAIDVAQRIDQENAVNEIMGKTQIGFGETLNRAFDPDMDINQSVGVFTRQRELMTPANISIEAAMKNMNKPGLSGIDVAPVGSPVGFNSSSSSRSVFGGGAFARRGPGGFTPGMPGARSTAVATRGAAGGSPPGGSSASRGTSSGQGSGAADRDKNSRRR